MNKETKIQTKIMLALSDAGCTVWRNETAGAWVGRKIYSNGDQVTLANARMVQFGLCKGGADIIGLTPFGRFLAIEVKTETGKATKEQINFIKQVNKCGGVAGIARTPADALEIALNE